MSSAQDYNQLQNDKTTHAAAVELAATGPAATAQPGTVTGTAYTAGPNDAGIFTRFTNAGPVAFTIPPNSAVPFPIGTELPYSQAGAGIVTVVPGAGVTVNSRGSVMTTAGRYAVAMLKKVATDTWLLTGDLA
jgi:hypothetical protein